MKWIDILLLGLIAAAVLLAVRSMAARGRRGKDCSGGCEGCPGCERGGGAWKP